MLLIRSPNDREDVDCNLDIIFSSVKHIELDTILGEISSIEVEKQISQHHNRYKLETEYGKFYVEANYFTVQKSYTQMTESPFK